MGRVSNDRNLSKLAFFGFLSFLSGSAALSHELLWTRRLVDLLGATDWVTARVLGLFFFGLSLGGFLATKTSGKRFSSLEVLILTEFSIFALSLVSAFLPGLTDWIWPLLGPEQLTSWTGKALKTTVAAFVVLPPSIAMGFTLPFFIRCISAHGKNIPRDATWIYTINTLGGVFGLWLVSNYLLSTWGAFYSMIATSAINGIIGLSLLTFRLTQPSVVSPDEDKHLVPNPPPKAEIESSDTPTKADSLNVTGWAFVSGFLIMAFEVLLFKSIALVVPSSYHATSALLANVIAWLALSSAFVTWGNSKPIVHRRLIRREFLSYAFLLASLTLVLCPLILYTWTDEFISIRYLQGLNNRSIGSIREYWWLLFCLVGVTGGIAILSLGLCFPILISYSSKLDPTTKPLGLMLAANGLGGLAGAELCNWFLVAILGPFQTYIVISCLTFGAACWMLHPLRKTNGNRKRLAVITVVGVLVIVAGLRVRNLPLISPKSTKKFDVIATRFARDGVFLVVEDSTGSKSLIANGQYMLGSTSAQLDQRRQLLIPLAFSS